MTRQQTSLVAKSSGIAAGVGSLLAAGIHQGFGGPEVSETLTAAQGQVPAGFLAQIEAAWIAGTASFVLLGVGLLWAALQRQGWLYSLGRAAAVWFVVVAIAFVWVAPNWGAGGVPAQAMLLLILGGLAAVASALSAPRRVR